MKRTSKVGLALILILALLLNMPIAGMATETDVGGLTMEELNGWASKVLEMARTNEPLSSGPQANKTEDGYEVVYDFATLYLDTPELTDNSVLNAITVTEEEVECPRGIGVFDTQQVLLEAFANENPTLLGSQDFAVLYLSDSLPEEALWGWVQRDGQQIQAVQYAVHERLSEDKYTDCGLLYSLGDGYITAVRAYGLSVSVSQAKVEETIAGVLAIQKEQAYFNYPQSSVGTDIDPFEREDLLFSGLDFLGLTPEAAVASLGTFETESWLQDDNGEWLRIIQWPNAEITFAYSRDKVFKRVDTFAVNQRGIEGPRGVQVGDTLSSVLMRFRHSEGEFDGTSSEVLYGDVKTPPYGLAEYDAATATLHYACPIEGGGDVKSVTLHMIFVDTILSELYLYSW
jgi:hypothetical protein